MTTLREKLNHKINFTSLLLAGFISILILIQRGRNLDRHNEHAKYKRVKQVASCKMVREPLTKKAARDQKLHGKAKALKQVLFLICTVDK